MAGRRELGPCAICGRPMIDGSSVDRQHWTPRSAGGQEAQYLHRVRRRMIHRLFDDKELATRYAGAVALALTPLTGLADEVADATDPKNAEMTKVRKKKKK